MAVTKSVFGKSPEGKEISLYTLSNDKGMKAEVTDLGAILVRLLVPDATGKVDDLVLGFDNGESYYGNDSFFGTVIGPCANRTGGAEYTLEGVTWQLDKNDGANNLHTHKQLGFHKRLWNAETAENSVTFSLEDEDGYLGFPGNKKVSVTYSLSEENELTLHYHATSDKKTIFNLTNHSYFNLDGHGAGSIEEHELWLGASHFTPVVPGAIPTGEIRAVAGTPLDFTQAKKIGRDIQEDYEQLILTGGYDHNFVIDGWDGTLRHIATVKGPKSGRVMKAYTTLPGVQFYAGNFIDEQSGKEGVTYGNRCGFALETQYFPDTIHHENFPSYVFGGENGREYDCVTVYKFEV